MNEIDRLKAKLQVEREKNKELKELIRQKRRKVLAELDEMKEKVKDILRSDDIE